ncbi:hypothetical protein [Alicyclobacillus ferrooxydans]|uniref:SWIM-type domain-containing protein n=1 Tax=Alicyclobacillus ferrooxydans TaxID=471514 RepID=A0A0P9EWX4_9BACL|nr:hypothetical protein [Alicyclobacillus ferrooxydans]KPV43619.1 hypothetical protein AN477_11490 [Alicyclobacillus ferrooxydans]
MARQGAQKSNTKNNSMIELKWKAVIDRIEVSRQRRGKAMEKQGQVTTLSIKDGRIVAEIQGPKMRYASQDYTVRMPFLDDGTTYQEQIASILFLRPDWLGALYRGQWTRDFWDRLSEMGLEWYPTERTAMKWLSGVTCTCREPEVPCFHVAAALFALLHKMEESPLLALGFLGLDTEHLLDKAHHIGGTTELGTSLTMVGQSQGMKLFGKEEEAVYQETVLSQSERIRHRLPPNWDESKQTIWRERYMAWE